MAVLGVVLFSSKAVMVKMAYQYPEVGHVELLLFRMVFALPFYILIAFWKRPANQEEIRLPDYLWIVVFGFLGYYLASLFDFMGLRYIKAGLERIILFIYPTLVVLLSWLFFGKRVVKVQILAILVTYLGVVITFLDELGAGAGQVYRGGFLILLSAFTYAAYLVGSGWLIPKFGVFRFTSYAMIVSTLCVGIHYAIVGDLSLGGHPWQVYALGLAMAIFATLLPSFLVSGAIARLGASTFAIFGSLGPVSTLILAYFFLDERITALQALGMTVVILGVALVTKKEKTRLPGSNSERNTPNSR